MINVFLTHMHTEGRLACHTHRGMCLAVVGVSRSVQTCSSGHLGRGSKALHCGVNTERLELG